MGKKSGPKPPDPYKVAQAQTSSNIETAREQARLAMTGQETPFGSVQYVRDPSSPSGFRSITELTPEQQALLQQSQDLQAQFGSVQGQQMGMFGDQLGRVEQVMQTPFDLGASRAQEITDIQQTFLDPEWQQRRDALETQLLNRGIRPGSEAYNREVERLEDERSRAYNRMFLDAYTTANNAALQERNLPFSDLAAVRGAQPTAQPGMPQFGSTPQPGVAPTDIAGPVYQSYQGQLSAHNNMMGGLFGLGSAALGGWAQAGFPGASAALAALPMISDERMKTDVRRVGTDPRGWGVYVFRYIWDGVKDAGLKIGFMAQEVEKIRPDAVTTDPVTGIKAVDYDALALA